MVSNPPASGLPIQAGSPADTQVDRAAGGLLGVGDLSGHADAMKIGYSAGDGSPAVIDSNNNKILGSGGGWTFQGLVILTNAAAFKTPAGAQATTATAGAQVLPANPVGFITFQDSAGTTRKLPYYAV